MNSRPTDVDREGLIHEVQRTVSCLSSSTDRSSVLHVPLSPGFDELRRRREQSPGQEDGVAAKQGAPSIADSAYFTNADKDRTRSSGPSQQQLAAGEGRELPRIPEQDERGQAARNVGAEAYAEEMDKIMFGGLDDAAWN